MEQTFFAWSETHMPVVALFCTITAFAVLIAISIVEHKNAIVRLEEDSRVLKKDVKSLKKDVRRLDNKIDLLGAKLDRLIAYLTATKTIDFKD